jgi:hypothetical protein
LQALAGSQEMINNLAQLPKGIAEYGANRLNLVPKSVVNAVSAITPEDTTQPINALFGQPTYPGEGLIRGVARNSGNILGAGALVKTLNPLKLTDRGIAKSILNEEKRQMDTHTKAYNSIWDEAKKKWV